jgi:hypothetical protein
MWLGGAEDPLRRCNMQCHKPFIRPVLEPQIMHRAGDLPRAGIGAIERAVALGRSINQR